MNALNEAVKEFLIESHENLEQLDSDLVALEKDPAASAMIASIFRTIHTLKGSAGFLAFKKLEAVTHVGESLLSRLRDKKLAITPEVITALLSMGDAVREMLAAIADTGSDGARDYAELIGRLSQFIDGKAPPAARPAAKATSYPESLDLPRTVVAQSDASAPPMLGPSSTGQAEREAAAVAESTVRLDIGRLDKLMNLASELVLARNQILQCAAGQTDTLLAGATRHLNLITSELQEEVMATRMQPIATIWSKFPRVVRDLAHACGKQVRLEMTGAETELDKSVVEAMKDPLTHLVRNAVDHGIEAPEARRAAAKPAEGRLFLRAYHEGGQVFLEITDDGGGIDVGRIRNKAFERGLVTPEQAAQMSDQSVLNLIFLPGFSTSEQISNISGRGIGMDVVKTNIEKIGGTVDVLSRVGVGTTIKMRIPLTLAIIRAIIVVSGGQRYAIPQASIVELVRLEGDKARASLERLHEATVYRFRGKLLPIVYLSRVLGEASGGTGSRPSSEPAGGEVPGGPATRATHAPNPSSGADTVNLVVLQADERQFGLVVDRILDAQEIVVKPLGSLLRGIECYAGATIMGDGRVALILDVLGLAKRLSVVVRSDQFRQLEAEGAALPQPRAEDVQHLVLVRRGGERLAVPLDQVVRLEEFAASAIERTGKQQVVQYRGRILPLLDVAALLDGRAPDGDSQPPDKRGSVHVVVCGDGDRAVGLMVDRILDIVAEPLTVKGRATRPHVLYPAVVRKQIFEVLDVPGIVRVGYEERQPASGGR